MRDIVPTTFTPSYSLFTPGMPISLWYFEFEPLLLLESFCKNACKWEMANFMRSRASLPRTTKAKLAHWYTQIINGGKCPSRTPKCNLQQSWAHDPIDSMSSSLVHAPESQAKREPSLVVGKGRISWSMVSLLAQTRQKQLAKSSPQ
jgi:hypothetical protein